MKSKEIMLRTTALCGSSILLLLSVTAPTLAEEGFQLPGVTIYSTTPRVPAEIEVINSEDNPDWIREDPHSPARPPSIGDGGEFLRHVNGVDAGRMGGHGLEPAIRGLDQNQISITNDGAYQFGGCPNRMDPPTSHMQLYTFDQVIIKKGYMSVTDGPAAPGGSIQFERLNPVFAPGDEITTNLKAGLGYNSQGDGLEVFVDGSMGNDFGYIRAFGSGATANNYEDGDGDDIRSSFDQFGGGIVVGRTFDADSWITLKIENNNVDDALFPGSGMDAPVTDDWTYQLKGQTDVSWGFVKAVEGDVYLTTVDHTMNNFDLRERLAPNPFLEAKMESDTLGGKMMFSGEVDDITFDFGADYRDVMRDGNRTAGPNGDFNPSTVQSVLWPDTSIKNVGVFGEMTMPVAIETKLVMGVRYDLVRASADEADQNAVAAPGLSPNDLYQRFYGKDASKDKTEHNVGGLVRVEHNMSDKFGIYGSVSRSVRTADASERYIASYMGAGGANSWVGNPDIDPEQHHMLDVGFAYKEKVFELSGSAYYNNVTDFIQLDSARSQRGVQETTTTASVYTNIDAVVAGLEFEGEYRFAENWRLGASVAFTYGENESDDIPLSQIAPLSGRMELAYDTSEWMAGVRMNAAAKQTRVDDDRTTGSGRDSSGDSDGYVTFDMFGAYNFTENFQVTGGVTNLLDAEYATHLNKTNLLDPTGVRVNEPGRSFYIRAVTKF